MPAFRPKMDLSVKVAVVALSIFIVTYVLQFFVTEIDSELIGSAIAAVVVGGVVLGGVIFGKRIAWEAARVLGFIMATVFSIFAFQLYQEGTKEYFQIFFFGLRSSLLFISFFSLGVEDSRQFFFMICPRCGSKRIRSIGRKLNFLRCKRCEHRW